MPVLYARPRHAAPRDHSKVRAALVPAVLLASTGSALGGLAVSASADQPGSAASSTAVLAGAEQLLVERTELIEERAARASRDRAEAEEAEAAAAEAARVEAERVAAAAAAAPKYARPGLGRISSPYGTRWGRMHSGVDLASGMNKPIVAAAAGTVLSAGWEGGYGYAVRIQHPDGTTTLYAHNTSVAVRKGEQVAAGEQIAREGSTGNSTGPHVHFEVRVGGNAVNPVTWLRARGVDI